MPPFFIQRKRVQISASTLAFSNRCRPSTLVMRKHTFRSSMATDYRVHDVSVFENIRFRRFRLSTLIRKESVFASLNFEICFRKPPFTWVKVSVFHRISVDDRRKRIQNKRFQTKTD